MSGLFARLFLMPRTPPPDDALTRVELARLEGTVAALVKELQGYRDWVNAELLDHEKRIRINERWRLAMPPAVLASVVSMLITFFHH